MTLEEKERFETFYFNILESGTLSFNFPHPYYESTTVRAFFTQPFQATNIGGLIFHISISLETESVV